MKQLKEKIKNLLNNSQIDEAVVTDIMHKNSAMPFTVEARLLTYLLSIGTISYEDYVSIVDEYTQRNIEENKYLYLFDMAPRTFGQTWGEQHIKKLFPKFVNATKQNLEKIYPSFDGEFDLWIDNIRVEVKACRANSTSTIGGLRERAYSHIEAQTANFKYHYQQLKPSCCDVFIWIGVCKDELLYWVLTSQELLHTGKLGPQHRNENTGNEAASVFEGQVFMTEEELQSFQVNETEILEKVKEKGKQ